MTSKYFLTGTDTEVGKTVVSCALLQAANKKGYLTAGYKPVASGSKMTSEGIRNSDALALQRNSTVSLTYQEVNPLVFMEPTSPHIVSAELNQPIDFSVLSEGLAVLVKKSDWVLVEGAGGWYTPLSENTTFADWVIQENLPVILTVGVKLGCINHAVLTAKAIQYAGLKLAGWVANEIEPAGKHQVAYLETLERMIPAPLLGVIPHLSGSYDKNNLGKYITIDSLVN
ncbi:MULTISPECIES: dethiobiotin synthase [Xenorhabdus]|uniref:ATP-dependent dethiobiotin synthetase BioD n=1 Tax=Xenorhabdus ehlersii TaxID=290111 RepID=A0A2D0ITP9_9GAMM|nr:dethiobiotin synthase [Xenorhabdus ehlersii]MBC8947830.1 dethiobiotin synthetase [Xenorhabdus sp. TS4]MBC8948768.1 dethiobiotin synthetase [Xenorhabdus sp. TS4]PHM25284.1 dethiobiotin synthetase [Xenorhabdus ehlersii]PHM26861.1 dethiobiotin synthetase [Xenorhabdus ehlersii]RKE90415.1 dethiobiotin synthase [Xenorhabdus ehlersii]